MWRIICETNQFKWKVILSSYDTQSDRNSSNSFFEKWGHVTARFPFVLTENDRTHIAREMMRTRSKLHSADVVVAQLNSQFSLVLNQD